MRKLLLAYIEFWWRSKNQHGVHSPFVFDLVTKCFYDTTIYPAYDTLKAYRSDLKSNKMAIQVTDLGAGSQVMTRDERLISDIAKNAGTTPKRAKLFYRLVRYFKSDTILELGTSLGIATHAMHLGHKDAQIISIEGCPNISNFTSQQLATYGVNNVEILTGDFSEIIQELDQESFDLIYFDGNHQKDATLHYFETLLSKAHNDSVFIFDDIYWSKGMTEAWETIIAHPKVTVSIDTFFWGLVFFRKEQVKQHFTIRL